MQNELTQPWHCQSVAQVLKSQDTCETGLTAAEVQRRLQRYGQNRLPAPHKKGPLARFAQQFHNVLIYVLLCAGLITALLGHWIDSGVIVGVVIINALIGFVQEGKAERALDAISNMLSHQAMAIRGGIHSTVAAEELVPGDIILLQSGDKVPADVRMFKTRELRIDEAMLTGESIPSEKNTQVCNEQVPLGDRHCMAYSGTLVTHGTGTGVVVGTGIDTEIGRISEMLGKVAVLETPLLRKIAQFGRWLTLLITVITVATFVFGVTLRHYTATEMFLAAVGLAVAAIPEGLPAIITITLAIGVQRMVNRNAIIRRLPAVETLGSVTTICSDKTGTLTRNEMAVQAVALGTGVFRVSGVGYDPQGGFSCDGEPINPQERPLLGELLQAAILCNDANLLHTDGQWQLNGDPTEGALVSLALKAGFQQADEHAQRPRVDVIPFESEHRFMATLHHDHEGQSFVYVKGAPERMLEMCRYQRMQDQDSPVDHAFWEQQMQELASRGQRVLAIAVRSVAPHMRDLTFADIHELTLLGIVGMIDPPRDQAVQAVQACHSAGIKVKMITGDHAATAQAIGGQLGIGLGRPALTGAAIDQLDEVQLQTKMAEVEVFARASPQHKLRIVSALQAAGEIVAMTGDGVNDAPALKRADVGVAMGMKGTSVAKETAEMVLVDDNFASIVNAVEEGRTVYDNIKKSIMFILPTNGGEALTILAAILLGRDLPITAAQILWVNMVTAVTLALALAFEPAENHVMARPPREPQEPLLTRYLIWRILFVSLILVSGTFGLFLFERNAGADVEYARTVAVNTLVVFEIFYLFSSRYLLEHAFRLEALISNRYVLMAIGVLIVLQLLFTYNGMFQTLFATKALTLHAWMNIVLVASSVFVLVELEKTVMRKLTQNRISLT